MLSFFIILYSSFLIFFNKFNFDPYIFHDCILTHNIQFKVLKEVISMVLWWNMMILGLLTHNWSFRSIFLPMLKTSMFISNSISKNWRKKIQKHWIKKSLLIYYLLAVDPTSLNHQHLKSFFQKTVTSIFTFLI